MNWQTYSADRTAKTHCPSCPFTSLRSSSAMAFAWTRALLSHSARSQYTSTQSTERCDTHTEWEVRPNCSPEITKQFCECLLLHWDRTEAERAATANPGANTVWQSVLTRNRLNFWILYTDIPDSFFCWLLLVWASFDTMTTKRASDDDTNVLWVIVLVAFGHELSFGHMTVNYIGWRSYRNVCMAAIAQMIPFSGFKYVALPLLVNGDTSDRRGNSAVSSGFRVSCASWFMELVNSPYVIHEYLNKQRSLKMSAHAFHMHGAITINKAVSTPGL